MVFNAEEHRKRQEILNHGRSKWPNEKNISKLYELACKDLGIEPRTLSTSTANHLPTPEESGKANPNKFAMLCPKCNKRTYYLTGLCRSCEEAEGGIYKTKFSCWECRHSERSKEPLVIWLQRLGIDFGIQTKESLGIRTITDDGIK